MSYDEQRISDQIDGGLLQQKKEHIKHYVKKWMNSHEPDTFVRNEHGAALYTAKHSTLNIQMFFEDLLADFIDDDEVVLTKANVSSFTPKLAGYLFNGRFYKTLDELRGRTMSESNKPIEVFFGNE